MVIEEPARADDLGAEPFERALEALRVGDRAHGEDPGAAQRVEGPLLAAEDVLQVERLVRRLDHLGGGVELAQRGANRRHVDALALGQHEKRRTPQAAQRLAQRATRQQAAVAERVRAVDQDEVVLARQAHVLEPVVEHEGIDTEIADRVQAGLDPVRVGEHDDAGQVLREHVRLVARGVGREQHTPAVGNDLRLVGDAAAEHALPQRRAALVAARQHGHLAPGVAQSRRQHLDHGRLARAAERDVAHADHQAPEPMPPEQAEPVQAGPGPHDEPIELRDPAEQPAQNDRANASTAPPNHVEKIRCQPLVHVPPVMRVGSSCAER